MPIYLFMGQQYGIGQAAVDEMELWVIAGMVNPTGEEPPDPHEDRMMTPEEFEAEAHRMLRQRVAAAGHGPALTIPHVQEGAAEDVT